MAANRSFESADPEVALLEPGVNGRPWPLDTKWRASLMVQGERQTPEWMLQRVKPVPLSSRTERDLLDAIANNKGTRVLELAANPGEHQVAAAVMAALRLARVYPERAIKFLSWLQGSPTDPSELRFIRRYLPKLEVLTFVEPTLPAAIPISSTALGVLHAELLRASGAIVAAEATLADLPDGLAKALAASALRLDMGNATGALAYCQDRPIRDDATAALASMSARALLAVGDPGQALTVANRVLDQPDLIDSVVQLTVPLKITAQRALGLDQEAALTESEFQGASDDHDDGDVLPSPKVEPAKSDLPIRSELPFVTPQVTLQEVAATLDKAWARVRRVDGRGAQYAMLTSAQIEAQVEEVVSFIKRGHFDTAETVLLALCDGADDAVDNGAPLNDAFLILLAGMFSKRDLPALELATLERVRDMYQRAGESLPEPVESRLMEVRASFDEATRSQS